MLLGLQDINRDQKRMNRKTEKTLTGWGRGRCEQMPAVADGGRLGGGRGRCGCQQVAAVAHSGRLGGCAFHSNTSAMFLCTVSHVNNTRPSGHACM